MSSSLPLPEKLAEAPFDNPRADLIMRTSDEVHFRVLKGILSIASPVFDEMFSIPPPPSEKQCDEIQVVSLSEDSTALDVVLRHIYPVRTPKGDTLLYATILAEFARKYQVEALDESITLYLKDSVERDPVGVYAIAVTYGYNSIGANAARSCLRLQFSGLQSPHLRCATMEVELLKYHVACGEATSAVASSDRSWFSILTDRFGSKATICKSCIMPDLQNSTLSGLETNYIGARCFWSYLYRSALVLAHHPTAEEVTTEAFIMKSNGCPSCENSIRRSMLEVGVALRREIEKAVERVPLPKAVSAVAASSATTATN